MTRRLFGPVAGSPPEMSTLTSGSLALHGRPGLAGVAIGRGGAVRRPGADRRVRRVALVGGALERRRRRGRQLADRRDALGRRRPPGARRRGARRPAARRAPSCSAPSGDITSQPRAVVDDQGHGAVVFARGNTAYLSGCEKGSCATPVKVGSSALKPDPDVAVQPGNGRLTVIWRGRSKGGSNRLQWRITTGGKLGAVHTLGEFGNDPRLGTDASGKTVAVWTRYAIHPSDPKGLRTAARRVGEFTRPATLQSGAVFSPQLVTGADGETIVAWLTSPTFDVQSPSAQARVATRTANTGFSAPANVGGADTGTLALDRAPDGHAVLALDRQLDETTAVVQAAVRAPGGAFSRAAGPRRAAVRLHCFRRDRGDRRSRRGDRRLVLGSGDCRSAGRLLRRALRRGGHVRRAPAARHGRDRRVPAAPRPGGGRQSHRCRLGHPGRAGGRTGLRLRGNTSR